MNKKINNRIQIINKYCNCHTTVINKRTKKKMIKSNNL